MKSVCERLNICSVSEASLYFPFGIVPDSVIFSNDKNLEKEFYSRFGYDFYLTKNEFPGDYYSALDILESFLDGFEDVELCIWLD